MPSKYLRISVTDKCNLSCYYCHHEGNFFNSDVILSAEDFYFVCKVALNCGFKKFKLTGGEPTLRKDICEIVQKLSSLNLPNFSMITNGTRLVEISADLWKAGLRRLNVSLNTLNPEHFLQIQFGKNFSQKNSSAVKKYSSLLKKILDGIDKAQTVGFKNIKLNFVFSSEKSDLELKHLIDFAKVHDCILVVLPVIEENSHYTLDYLYHLIKNFGIKSEELIIDEEGIRKRLLHLNSGGKILLRVDELADCKPYIFCDECENKIQCREGIFPIRFSAHGKIIPCMASDKNIIDAADFVKNRNVTALISAFEKIGGWYNVPE